MTDTIITLNDRGQCTIPKAMRTNTKHFTVREVQGEIVLTPLQTREEYFAELEEAQKDFDKNGGQTVDEVATELGITL